MVQCKDDSSKGKFFKNAQICVGPRSESSEESALHHRDMNLEDTDGAHSLEAKVRKHSQLHDIKVLMVEIGLQRSVVCVILHHFLQRF